MPKSTFRCKNRSKIYFILSLVFFLFQCSSPTHHILQVGADNIDVSTQSSDDEKVKNLIAPYKSKLESKMNTIVGEVTTKLVKDSPESTMGNWVADCILDYLNAKKWTIDLSIANSGGLRINEITKGPLTKATIYELCPFDNYIVIMEMDINLLTQLLEHIIKNGGWPLSRGWQITTSNHKIIDIQYQGEPLEDRIYSVALPDYIANGGSNSDFLIGKDYENTSIYYRDALIEQAQIQNQNENGISAKIENRIIVQ